MEKGNFNQPDRSESPVRFNKNSQITLCKTSFYLKADKRRKLKKNILISILKSQY